MAGGLEGKQRAAVEAILRSAARKKVIVAGPGTGKTSLFREVLDGRAAGKDRSLILTFINNLKDELERDLGHLAQVFTFHGYCRHLLHRIGELRLNLSEHFRYFPALVSIIKRDWEAGRGGEAPQFVGMMRNAARGDELEFYLDRANYYDAVSFDDSVYRVWRRLSEQPELVSEYDLVLVDEYQDFNLLEARPPAEVPRGRAREAACRQRSDIASINFRTPCMSQRGAPSSRLGASRLPRLVVDGVLALFSHGFLEPPEVAQ